MEILVLLVVPPLVALVGLAVLPVGRPFFAGLGVFVLACVVAALSIFPMDPPSGPDDWYHGIEAFSLFSAIAAAALVIPAQLWRYYRHRRGQHTHYVPVLLGLLVISAFLFFSLGSGF